MGLRDIRLSYEYRSDLSDVVVDFYVPCLSQSIEYWRAVGYFTSQGLALAAKGLAAFIRTGGRMRLVASPWLESEDIEAFLRGYKAREDVVERALLRQLTDEVLEQATPLARHRLECLAWLIGEGRLDIKVACPEISLAGKEQGLYHEKMGLFFDAQGNVVAFTGSPNETVGGLVTNFESFDVYMSWDDVHGRVERKKANFERLWENSTAGLVIFDFPVAARSKLLHLRPPTTPSPNYETQATKPSSDHVASHDSIGVPESIQLRDYQQAALKSWTEHNGRGVLAMATGSGKTITALASSVEILRQRGRLFAIVACPFQHLVDQWANEARRFGYRPILAYQARGNWEAQLQSRIIDYNLGTRKSVLVIASHATFIGDAMQQALSGLKGPALLIADEVHHLGASESKRRLPMFVEYRMGLSATPDRWFDDEGTKVLHDYFGPTVFEFSLKDGIRVGCLTEYYYYPKLVELTTDELVEYEELTAKIGQLFWKTKDGEEDPVLGALLRKRANLLNNAVNKISALFDLVTSGGAIHHALFYCVPGQIDEVIDLLGNRLGLRIHRFTAEESTEERRQLLRNFDVGELQGLVAMRCLDEGVDVPSTETAYILASSSNPREFIQRRGRILRKSPGKNHAVIYDLIAVPSRLRADKDDRTSTFRIERQIMKKELARFREFADAAVNRFQATEVIWELAKWYDLLDF